MNTSLVMNQRPTTWTIAPRHICLDKTRSTEVPPTARCLHRGIVDTRQRRIKFVIADLTRYVFGCNICDIHLLELIDQVSRLGAIATGRQNRIVEGLSVGLVASLCLFMFYIFILRVVLPVAIVFMYTCIPPGAADAACSHTHSPHPRQSHMPSRSWPRQNNPMNMPQQGSVTATLPLLCQAGSARSVYPGVD
jgi:hypothetical protein